MEKLTEEERISELCHAQIEENYKLSLENYTLKLQVEEMQKTFEWYGEKRNYFERNALPASDTEGTEWPIIEDEGERARQWVKSLKEEKKRF